MEPLEHVKRADLIGRGSDMQLTTDISSPYSINLKNLKDIPNPHNNLEHNKSNTIVGIPKKILKVKRDRLGLMAQVQWEEKGDGCLPETSWCYTSELRKDKRAAKLLLCYYESIIV